MMTTNLHCQYSERYDVSVQWVRKHGNQPVGGQDYFAVVISAHGNEVTLFLSPAQLESLAAKLIQAAQDRGVVLAEEAKASAPLELAGGS